MRRFALPLVFALLGCPRAPAEVHERMDDGTDGAAIRSGSVQDAPIQTGDASAPEASVDASPPEFAPTSPQKLHDEGQKTHYETREDLQRITLRDGEDAGAASLGLWRFRYAPGFWSQGRKLPFPLEGTVDRAQHNISKEQCLARLAPVTLQTDAQKQRCKGEANMVPIYRGGDESAAKTCIDIFEYPNRACELPFVWGNPTDASQICAASGKRLCDQNEWNLACGGDPAGGPPSRYAYGDEPNLAICNTNKPHPTRKESSMWVCNASNAKSAWETCATETEPSGSFPECRSRFGVFDLHGNVAEMMSRKEKTGLVTQLKGSAFFYVDVFRRHDDNELKKNGRETYPDHCTYDPRWHVEDLSKALHSNYHLGFRCCKDI